MKRFFLKHKLSPKNISVVLALFFMLSASPASAFAEASADKLAAGCGNNQEYFSLASFLNPVASLAEKVAKDFGYQISLAAAPERELNFDEIYGRL